MRIYFSVLVLFISIQVIAQSDIGKFKKFEIGTEFQLYPVGYIPTLTTNYYLNENLALRFRIGGNFANRQDFSGLNDDEKAKGYGGSIGVYKFLKPNKTGKFFIGFSIDGWNMWVKWIDKSELINKGETYNLVIQPWINAGYYYNLNKNISIGGGLGFGREINVITKGEEVGQGFMGSLTIGTNIKFLLYLNIVKRF